MDKDELKTAIAVIFQRKGVDEMDKEDFIYTPSAELDWFSLKACRRMLENAVTNGFVSLENETVKLEFDRSDIDIPFGFQPSRNILKKKKKDIFQRILDDIEKKSGLSKQEIMAKVNEKQDAIDIEIEAALLLVARDNDIELDREKEYIDKVKKKVRGL